MNNVVIVNGLRSPFVKRNKHFKDISAIQLGGQVISGICKQSKVNPEALYMGCVYTDGLGQNPALQMYRESSHLQISAVNINSVCGSGLESIFLASDSIKAGRYKTVLAGGTESMSNTSNIDDGLFNKIDNVNMLTEMSLYESHPDYQLHQDISNEYMKKTMSCELNKDFILPIKTCYGDIYEDMDFPVLKKYCFNSDGSAILLLMDEEYAKLNGYKPLARIVGYKTVGVNHFKNKPSLPYTPFLAMTNLLNDINLSLDEIDDFEINEAFVDVVANTIKLSNIPINKVNRNGGALRIGHPLSASGPRMILNIISRMMKNDYIKYGLVTLCIGSGMGSAIILERI